VDNFAVDGKRFMALRDLPARCVVILSPLRSDIRDVVVPAGEVLEVVSAHDDLVSCTPRRYAALEETLVAATTRGEPGYKGYGLVLDRAVVEGGSSPHADAGAE
jgi:hypothetical protein